MGAGSILIAKVDFQPQMSWIPLFDHALSFLFGAGTLTVGVNHRNLRKR